MAVSKSRTAQLSAANLSVQKLKVRDDDDDYNEGCETDANIIHIIIISATITPRLP